MMYHMKPLFTENLTDETLKPTWLCRLKFINDYIRKICPLETQVYGFERFCGFCVNAKNIREEIVVQTV